MSILQNLKWALPISNDYRVWWQTWSGSQISFDSYSTRSKFGEEIMKILDTDAKECALQIVPKTCRLKEITDIIPIYKQLENEPGYYCESELIVRQN